MIVELLKKAVTATVLRTPRRSARLADVLRGGRDLVTRTGATRSWELDRTHAPRRAWPSSGNGASREGRRPCRPGGPLPDAWPQSCCCGRCPPRAHSMLATNRFRASNSPGDRAASCTSSPTCCANASRIQRTKRGKPTWPVLPAATGTTAAAMERRICWAAYWEPPSCTTLGCHSAGTGFMTASPWSRSSLVGRPPHASSLRRARACSR
mmetsp:Transcript_52019/g.163348  ORF Transcript_52019/g.163348 Transcript_52019/m.163348 type:complete len:210 (-) Transcript_52019:120-749(-)